MTSCPVCGSVMRRYENPPRLVCTNIKAHDAALARAKVRGTPRGRGGWERRKKKNEGKPVTPDDLAAYYEHRVAGTKAEAEANIAEFVRMFAGWDEDLLSALILDLGMLLGTKRGTPGRQHLLSALLALNELIHRSDDYRRSQS